MSHELHHHIAHPLLLTSIHACQHIKGNKMENFPKERLSMTQWITKTMTIDPTKLMLAKSLKTTTSPNPHPPSFFPFFCLFYFLFLFFVFLKLFSFFLLIIVSYLDSWKIMVSPPETMPCQDLYLEKKRKKKKRKEKKKPRHSPPDFLPSSNSCRTRPPP